MTAPQRPAQNGHLADVAAGCFFGWLGAMVCIGGVGLGIMANFWPGWIMCAAGLGSIYYGLWRLAR